LTISRIDNTGSVNKTLETVAMAPKAGYGTVISHRFGASEDAFIADFAVGTSADQTQLGSPCRLEHIGKSDRLLAIKCELGKKVPCGGRMFIVGN